MAKAVAILSALCILAFATTVCQADEAFNVVGTVYCDPCRVQFWTKLSEYIEGATVHLECKNLDSNRVTFAADAKTDSNGTYTILVEGEHANDVCEVKAVTSPRNDCNSILDSELDRARIVCSERTGIDDTNRYANALPFVTKEQAPACKDILEEIGLNADGTEILDNED